MKPITVLCAALLLVINTNHSLAENWARRAFKERACSARMGFPYSAATRNRSLGVRRYRLIRTFGGPLSTPYLSCH